MMAVASFNSRGQLVVCGGGLVCGYMYGCGATDWYISHTHSSFPPSNACFLQIGAACTRAYAHMRAATFSSPTAKVRASATWTTPPLPPGRLENVLVKGSRGGRYCTVYCVGMYIRKHVCTQTGKGGERKQKGRTKMFPAVWGCPTPAEMLLLSGVRAGGKGREEKGKKGKKGGGRGDKVSVVLLIYDIRNSFSGWGFGG